MYHKNINVWIRFLYNIIDLSLFLGVNALCYYLLFINKNSITAANYYGFIAISFVYDLIFFMFIPWMFNYRTIGMIITRVQVLGNNQPTWKVLLKRGEFTFWYWALCLLIPLLLVMPNEIETFKQTILRNDLSNQRLVIANKLLETLSGFWVFLTLINYVLNLARADHLSLFDKWTNTRVVYLKHYQIDSLESNKLIPFESQNEKVTIHE